jgi:hypothetical protein
MKLARRLSKAYLRLIRRSRVARRTSILVAFAAILAFGPAWVLALSCLLVALSLVAMFAVRDGLFDPVLSNKVDDDWF